MPETTATTPVSPEESEAINAGTQFAVAGGREMQPVSPEQAEAVSGGTQFALAGTD